MYVVGILAAIAYRLSRHRFLHLPLDIAIVAASVMLLVYGAAGLLFNGAWPVSPWLACLLTIWSGASLSLRARSFVLFQEDEAQLAGEGALPPFQQLPLRATGVFEVGGARKFFAQATGSIEATALGDRIVTVRVQPVSVIGLLRSPQDEWGCWYCFFRPEELSSAVRGRLHFGPRAWPALRLTLRGRPKPLILAFGEPRTRDLVAADLRPLCSS